MYVFKFFENVIWNLIPNLKDKIFHKSIKHEHIEYRLFPMQTLYIDNSVNLQFEMRMAHPIDS